MKIRNNREKKKKKKRGERREEKQKNYQSLEKNTITIGKERALLKKYTNIFFFYSCFLPLAAKA